MMKLNDLIDLLVDMKDKVGGEVEVSVMGFGDDAQDEPIQEVEEYMDHVYVRIGSI